MNAILHFSDAVDIPVRHLPAIFYLGHHISLPPLPSILALSKMKTCHLREEKRGIDNKNQNITWGTCQ